MPMTPQVNTLLAAFSPCFLSLSHNKQKGKDRRVGLKIQKQWIREDKKRGIEQSESASAALKKGRNDDDDEEKIRQMCVSLFYRSMEI